MTDAHGLAAPISAVRYAADQIEKQMEWLDLGSSLRHTHEVMLPGIRAALRILDALTDRNCLGRLVFLADLQPDEADSLEWFGVNVGGPPGIGLGEPYCRKADRLAALLARAGGGGG